MQFKLVSFAAALFAVAAAQTGCVIIDEEGATCPVDFVVCGPVVVGETKCCPDVGVCPL
ncbi:hypothetical protein B0H14DRAFT_3481837 [Mycena olivaceomarginata]|nr:hypothetical protein B0H14DRAFT_3481837 [Mycena olivaceomarginata]